MRNNFCTLLGHVKCYIPIWRHMGMSCECVCKNLFCPSTERGKTVLLLIFLTYFKALHLTKMTQETAFSFFTSCSSPLLCFVMLSEIKVFIIKYCYRKLCLGSVFPWVNEQYLPTKYLLQCSCCSASYAFGCLHQMCNPDCIFSPHAFPSWHLAPLGSSEDGHCRLLYSALNSALSRDRVSLTYIATL